MSVSKVPVNGRVAVIGAGISGLSFAYFLNKLRPDIKLDIYEKNSTNGGWINSRQVVVNKRPVVLEKGPRTLRGAGEGTLLIVDILKSLGLGSQVEVLAKESIANNKYIVNQDKKIVKVPDNVKSGLQFLGNTSLMNYEFISGIAKEPWVKKGNEDESIESFFKRRFGSNVLTNQILSAVLHGIYAGDVSKLSIKSILPSLAQLEEKSGSVVRAAFQKALSKSPVQEPVLNPALSKYEELISPDANLLQLSQSLKAYPMLKLQDGLQVLPKAIEQHLAKQPTVKFHYNAHIDKINSNTGSIDVGGEAQNYSHIRSTINTNELSHLLQDSIKGLGLEYVSILLVNLYVPKCINLIPKGKNGFGFLVPKFNNQLNTNPNSLLGVIYDSDVENHVQKLDSSTLNDRHQYEKITLMMGGHYFNKSGIPSSSVSKKMIRKVLDEYLQVDLSKYSLKYINDADAVELVDNEILVSESLHENCIPQYNVGYNREKQSVLDQLSSSKLSVGGMAFGNGVGVPDCVVNSLEGALSLR